MCEHHEPFEPEKCDRTSEVRAGSKTEVAVSGCITARRYMADSSYWLYLIHLPIVMALQVMVPPRLALADEVRDDSAGRPPAHVCQLPVPGAVRRHWSGAEWPSGTKALASHLVSSKPIVNFLVNAPDVDRDEVRSMSMC
jgi:hypothetical protein